jgi:glycosyltransferase involved in cell wall biosynthesis
MTQPDHPTHAQTLRFSFVVPALNEAILLAHLLDSIRSLEQTPNACVHEVIVVDAASTDGTPEVAAAGGCVIVSAEPGNVAQSRNLGAGYATGNVLAFIDADCELPGDWLVRAAAELADRNTVGVGMNMAAPAACAPWVERTWFELAHRQHRQTGSVDVDWLATFNLAVRKETFDAAGGFDSHLVTCEDVELGYRLGHQGQLRFIHAQEPSGVVHHGESRTLSEFFRRESWRARGTLPLLVHHWKNPREIISSFLPLVVIAFLIVSALAVVGCPVPGVDFDNSWHRPLLILAGLLPLILLTVRRRVPMKSLLPSLLLLTTYFLARSRGTFWPAKRVAGRTLYGEGVQSSLCASRTVDRALKGTERVVLGAGDQSR